MKRTLLLTICVVVLVITVEGRKVSRSRSSSGRGSGRKTNSNSQPAPTSFSNPQASAPKPTLFGWQEKPAHTQTRQSNPSNSQSHSYPSSNTGLSGNSPPKQPPPYQESVQRSAVPHQQTSLAGTQSQTNNKPSHSYPSSNGLSGNSGSPGYPQGSGLSGSGSIPSHGAGNGYSNSGGGSGYPPGKGLSGGGAGYPQANGGSGAGGAYPHQQGTGSSGGYPHNSAGTGVGYSQGSGAYGGPPPPYPGYRSGTYNGGNHAHPPYTGGGYNYGGYGAHGYHPSYTPQMPGYFGNYGNKGFGGVSRSGSALTGIGIAGAGVGTILTGLALWNLARSTGHRHHTVIYDNRGQPVAVAPANGTDPVVDPFLQDLVNCTLTISSDNSTEVLAIPCAIATSFTPEADVKDDASDGSKTDNTKCTVTVMKKTGKEFMTTIPCSILLNTAAENNVTEPTIPNEDMLNANATIPEHPNGMLEPKDLAQPNPPAALKFTGDDQNDNNTKLLNCSSNLEKGDIRDPINPCYAVSYNLTVLPLEPTDATKETER